MGVEWKDEEVRDHSSGVTDLITASSPDFQHYCNNLTHNFRIGLLSSRDGYLHYTTVQTPTKIQQLFKLEDWIIAYCFNDVTTPGDQVSGQLYYRLETDTVSAWTAVATPKARDTATIYRIYDSASKGFTVSFNPSDYDNWVVKDGSNPGSVPVISYSGETVNVTIDVTKLNSDLQYDTGAGLLTYAFFQTAFTPVVSTTTLFTSTLSTDIVTFDEKLLVQETASALLGIYPANARSEGFGTALPFMDEEGHLQSSDWQSHLYLALEPYIKTFTANASDPYGRDPDTYPPDNNRLPLRKVAPLATAVGIEPFAYVPSGFNAQLPKTFIATDPSQSELNDYTDATKDFRYQVWSLRWDYSSPTYLGETTATIEIWCERSWGQVGALGVMPSASYLRYDTFNAQNPVDSDLPFLLADYGIQAVSPYSGIIGGIDWGKLFLVFHQQDAAAVQYEKLTYTATVEAIQAAFAEYQSRSVKIAATDYYASNEQFGYYIKTNPQARVDENLYLLDCFLDVRYADNLPEDVPGNYQYGYSFFMRDTYEGSFEGSPRQFIFDGPASFEQTRTLSKIGLPPIKAYTDATRAVSVQFSTSPQIYGGIAARMLRTTDLYYQSTMEAIFARTLTGGDVYYIDQAARYWLRTADLTAPTLPQGLIDDDWLVETAYVVPHQSETTDEDLQFLEQAYFNGGVLSYDSLPQGPYYFAITNQVGYYGNIVNNIQRVYQSTPGIPHAAPATLFEDIDDELSGISQYSDKPIITTQNKIWRMEGVKTSTGDGRTFLRTVSDEYGCIANQSIVLTNVGLFLWSNAGIVYTDGLKAFRVTEHLIDRYNGWLSVVRGGTSEIGTSQLRGRYDELNRLVYWSLFDADEKPFFVVLSLQKGISPMMPITTHDGVRHESVDEITGVITTTDYFNTHATLYSDDYQRWYRSQGRDLLYASKDQTYDESDVTALKHPILPYMRSIAFAYGMPWSRKFTTRVMMNLRDLTSTGVSLTPLGWNDLTDESHKLANCLNYQHLPFALDYATGSLLDLQQFFRHTDCSWKSQHLVSYKRHFPKGKIRNSFKQFGFQALKFKYSTIESTTSGITDLQVVIKAGLPQAVALIEITVTNPLSNPVIDLELDASGQFMLTYDDTMEPAAVCDVTLVGSVYTISVMPDVDALSGAVDYTQRWPTLSFYRYFYDQRIDLIGYNLTYRMIGDRTHGMIKSAAKGGVIA